jgi:hypothetical protein
MKSILLDQWNIGVIYKEKGYYIVGVLIFEYFLLRKN